MGCAVVCGLSVCGDKEGYVGHGWRGRTVSCTLTGHPVPNAHGLHHPLRPVGGSWGASGKVPGRFVGCVRRASGTHTRRPELPVSESFVPTLPGVPVGLWGGDQCSDRVVVTVSLSGTSQRKVPCVLGLLAGDSRQEV